MRGHKSAADEDFEVWPENWSSLIFFLSRAQTQWNTASGMDGTRYIGLNYVAIESSMNMSRIKAADRPALFDALLVIEREALNVWNKSEG